MSKISYSYLALPRLSDGRFVEFSQNSKGFIPMVSGGHNVYAPGHIVLKKSIDVPKKSDCALSKELSKKLQEKERKEKERIFYNDFITNKKQEKERRFYGDFLTNPKQETEVSKNPLPEKEIDLSRQPDTKDERDYDLYPPIRSMEKSDKFEKDKKIRKVGRKWKGIFN